MATSNSTPDAPPGPEPRREALGTVSAQIAALDEIVALARTSIRVFDVDLSGTGWNGAGRAAAVGVFLRARSDATLQIIVHDTRWIESSCPRLTQLLRHYAHAITILRTGDAARSAMDPLAIVDGRHFLHRFHVDQPRAELGVEQPLAAQPLVERFDEIWATGEPGLNATVLGL